MRYSPPCSTSSLSWLPTGLILITDKNFAGRLTEADLARCGITLLRPARKDEPARCGEPLLKTIRQLIESVNDTLKGQLDRGLFSAVAPVAGDGGSGVTDLGCLSWAGIVLMPA